jgi:hypothetical protein
MELVTRQEKYDPLDTEAKRRVRQKIGEMLTPELKQECPGLAILVLTVDEYEIVRSALRESGQRKMNILKSNNSGIFLNIVRDNNIRN